MSEMFNRLNNLSNLRKAWKHVRSNDGCAGVDRITLHRYSKNLELNLRRLSNSIKSSKYTPSPIRRIPIQKETGGVRLLGIPTIQDRIVQQAILQIIEDEFEERFHPRSYGFRKHMGAHLALRDLYDECSVNPRINPAVNTWLTSMDITSFFDDINQDILLNQISQVVSDKEILRLIRLVIKPGSSKPGYGTPQGGPLSPLCANIYLNSLDILLKARGLNFFRYADDLVLLTNSRKAACRSVHSVTRDLKKLKLRNNLEKTQINLWYESKYLGLQLTRDGFDWIPSKVELFKKNFMKKKTHEEKVKFTKGWLAYYGIAEHPKLLDHLDAWCRARCRARINISLKSLHKNLHEQV